MKCNPVQRLMEAFRRGYQKDSIFSICFNISAGQWNTLVNFGLTLILFEDQFLMGCSSLEQTPRIERYPSRGWMPFV